MSGETDEFDLYGRRCWDSALHTYATHYVFERRARRLHRKLRLTNWVGIAVPIAIGILAASSVSLKILTIVIAVSVVVGVVQVTVNAWSLVATWIEDYAYATGSASANSILSKRFRELAEQPPADLELFRSRYEMLSIEDNARTGRDMEKGVTPEEKRMGMRAALRKFRRACAGCDQVPTTMQSSDCGVCGNYSLSE